jgi:hypothetical protein
MSLTDAERETIIGWSEADDLARIYTASRKVITKLRASGATLTEEGTFEGTAWARFEIPWDLITFRSARREMTEAQRAAATANLSRARAAQ